MPTIYDLIRALKSDVVRDRQAAAYTLGRTGDPKAVDHLINALNDDDWRVRERASWSLGSIGNTPLQNVIFKTRLKSFK